MEYQHFPWKIFCLTVPIIFVGESFTVGVFFGTGKVWITRGRGSIKIFLRKKFSQKAENFGRVILSCCINFGYRKGLDKRGGNIKIIRGIFLFHSAGKFRRGIFYCCSNFGYRKRLDKKGVDYQHFPSKVFCLTVPKIFAGEPLCALFQKISGSEKVYG